MIPLPPFSPYFLPSFPRGRCCNQTEIKLCKVVGINKQMDDIETKRERKKEKKRGRRKRRG